MKADLDVVGKALGLSPELLAKAQNATINIEIKTDGANFDMTLQGPQGAVTMIWRTRAETYAEILTQMIEQYARPLKFSSAPVEPEKPGQMA